MASAASRAGFKFKGGMKGKVNELRSGSELSIVGTDSERFISSEFRLWVIGFTRPFDTSCCRRAIVEGSGAGDADKQGW